VKVEALVCERRRIDAEFGRVRTHVGHRDLGGLFHHVAQLTRQRKTLGAIGHARLNEENVTAGARDGETGSDTGHTRTIGRLEVEPGSTEPLAHVLCVNADGASRSPEASLVASLRSSRPISRSRERTPASRV